MATRTETPLHFSRFEFKYVLRAARRDEVEAELQHFVQFDPYVQDRPGHEYCVRSLYFDDPGFAAYHQKQDGQHTRAKFRLRTYTRALAEPAPVFLEIKGRWNNLVFKHRTPLDPGFDRAARGDALCRAILAHTGKDAVHGEFEFQLFRRQLRPVVLVDYLRRPYVSRFDPEFRLTFDHELTAAATDTLFPAAANHRRLVPGCTVMEVKFRHQVPAWFHRIVQAYELRRVSFSKVCAGTEALGLQLDPN